MEHASVVIVGGGVIGASIAFHLAEAGVEDVLLLERRELGSGSTAAGAGGVRAMFSDELNVRIGLRSLEAWAAFGERPGWEIDLQRVGYLFLLSSHDEVTEFERGVELQNRLGVPSRMVSVEEAQRAVAARGHGRRARGRVLPARRARDPGRRRPGLRGRGTRERSAHRDASRGNGTRKGSRPHRQRGHRDRVRRVCGWAVVAGDRRHGGRGSARQARAKEDRLHRAAWNRAQPADDGRLRHRLLLPPRGAGASCSARATSATPRTSGSSGPSPSCGGGPRSSWTPRSRAAGGATTR